MILIKPCLRSSDVHDETDNTNLVKDLSILSNVTGSLELKKYDKCKVKIDPNSEFIVVKDKRNNKSIVRKSSICCLLSKDQSTLSSDTLQRVKDCELQKYKNNFKKLNSNAQLVYEKKIY